VLARLSLLLAVFAVWTNAEIRGVWVDRVSLASRAEIRATMQAVARAHFNTVHLNVWSRGYPLWRSEVFRQETGIDVDPGFGGRDVLWEAVEEAREAGLAVIPWFEYGFVGGWSGYRPGRDGRGPIFDTHPEWLARTRSGEARFPIAGGGGDFFWMAHTRPDVQEFLITMVREVAAGYDVPAVEFDRARYPQLDCGYDAYTRQLWADTHAGASLPDNPNDPEFLRWRTGQLNLFIQRLYRGVKDANWRTLISNAPVPLPTSISNFAQDYGAWMREGSLDFVTPQLYRPNAAAFERDLDNQIRSLPSSSATRLVPGLDVTNGGVDELIAMIRAVRARSLPGFVVWYYRGIGATGLERLRDSVLVEKAPLPWR
jgi:uncharacterized lipoprotein YddW (UPF0748 family)